MNHLQLQTIPNYQNVKKSENSYRIHTLVFNVEMIWGRHGVCFAEELTFLAGDVKEMAAGMMEDVGDLAFEAFAKP